MKDLKGKTAFITGGASGIGLGIAKAFAKYGMKVVIADSRQEALDEAMGYFKKTGQPVHPIKLDVTDREAYARAADEAEKVFEKIHVLVNNAGVDCGGAIQQLTFKDWDFGLGVNLIGVINGMVVVLPHILKHGEEGHVVSTSSTCGLMGSANMAIYCTSKYAICGMMECAATDLQDKGIGVSILVPGLTRSNMHASTAANRPPELRNEGEPWPPPPPKRDPKRPVYDINDVFMEPEETGERVVRGIRNNDLFIITHPEWKRGYNGRHEAIMRACPDEPRKEKRWNIIQTFGTIIYNDIYDKQKQVGPPDWE